MQSECYAVMLGGDPVGFVSRQENGKWRAEVALSVDEINQVGDNYLTADAARDALTETIIEETVKLFTPVQ